MMAFAIATKERSMSEDNDDEKVQGETETATTLSPFNPDPVPGKIVFNALCSHCKAIFARVDWSNENEQSFPFNDTKVLIDSAAKGCHFCCQIWNEMHERNPNDIDGLESGAIVRPLVLEVYCYLAVVKLKLKDTISLHPLSHPHWMRCSDALRFQHLKFSNSLHTESETSWNQVADWMKQCSLYHAICKPGKTIIPSDRWPKRLIAVGRMASRKVRACETSTLDCSMLIYMTLSHCWGDIVPTRLLNENYSSFLEGIELEALPKTFSDAVKVTRKLGVKYLWIDSLCIIQDSAEDWANESSKMCEVYANSHLNLAAGGSRDANGGLFFPRDLLSTTPCIVQVGADAGMKYAASGGRTPEQQHRDMVLWSRAWVFQEMVLAPRTLFFGKEELEWTCCELNGTETLPNGDIGMCYLWEWNDFRLQKNWRELHKQDHLSLWLIWHEVVEEYSTKKLTKFSDKLIAVAGLATDCGKSWDAEYLAGLWSYRLGKDLLWYCRLKPGLRSQLSYTAPSWSWASVNGPIDWPRSFTKRWHVDNRDHYTVEGLIEVLETSAEPLTPSYPYGAVVNGYIRLKGPLVQAQLEQFSDKRRYVLLREDLGAADLEERRPDPISDDYVSENEASKAILKDSGTDLETKSEELPLVWKIESWIYWDDMNFENAMAIRNIYLVPFEVVTALKMVLSGLILVPTQNLKNGEVRRIGYFEISDDSSENCVKMRHLFRKGSVQKDEGLSENLNSEDDPYGNGVINPTLTDRYIQRGFGSSTLSKCQLLPQHYRVEIQ